jgi:hypothetical protein
MFMKNLSKGKLWDKWLTYISSISAGVRHVTSGRINHAITTATIPVPAKLRE